MTRSTKTSCPPSSSSQRSLGAALLASFVAVLVLTASCRPQEEQGEREDYRAGYADGLEDQRAHICGVMRDEDHAYEALRNERICP
jgi:hypothetical protein